MNRITSRPLFSTRHFCTTFVIVVLCATGLAANANIKCWKNNDGIRECGNSVPPEYAQQGHQVITPGGVNQKITGPAKSMEELEAERALERENIAAAKLKSEQQALDRVLLDTFSSEDDMILARDGQMTHLDSQIKLTDSHIAKLNTNLEELIEDAANHERRGDDPPEKLVNQIGSLRDQIRDNKQFIATKHRDKANIMKKFEQDIARFRKLKGSDR